jgi:cysteine dioxygenase
MAASDQQTRHTPAAISTQPVTAGALYIQAGQFAVSVRRPDLPEITSWLQQLPLAIDDLRPYIGFKAGTYARHRVFRNEQFELLVLCWRPGQRTPIHDHNGSYGVIRVCSGVLWETMFAMDERRGLVYQAAREWTDGCITGADIPDIHQIGNPDVSGQDLVTLHLYAPPLGSLNIYKLGSAESTSTINLNSWNPTI